MANYPIRWTESLSIPLVEPSLEGGGWCHIAADDPEPIRVVSVPSNKLHAVLGTMPDHPDYAAVVVSPLIKEPLSGCSVTITRFGKDRVHTFNIVESLEQHHTELDVMSAYSEPQEI